MNSTNSPNKMLIRFLHPILLSSENFPYRSWRGLRPDTASKLSRIFGIILLVCICSPIFAQNGEAEEEKTEATEQSEENISDELPFEMETRKSEIGAWVGASNPFPGSATQSILDTTLGFGVFYRRPWPSFLYTEFGFSYSTYLSPTERALTTVPVYAALAYKLPIQLPVQFFLKAGGGAAYVGERPANVSRWDPLVYAGFEASFVAAQSIRIGLRLDYDQIMETNLSPPALSQFPYSGYNLEPRLNNPKYFKLKNGEFFHFGLMVSVFL